MSETAFVGLLTAGAALLGGVLGGLIGTIPAILQHRIRSKEVEQQRLARFHSQTVDLLRVYIDRVKLLEHGKGVYETLDPPLLLYKIFYQIMKDIDEGKAKDWPPYARELLERQLIAINRNPKQQGL